jgi:hypothetical protein
MATIRNSIATPTANCYVGLASANSYFESRWTTEKWDSIGNGTNATASDNIKSSILIQATREIDNTYRFFGSKENGGLKGADDYQALEFPRAQHVDTNGNVIIEDDIKYATYEQALWILERQTSRKTEEGTIINRAFFGKEAYTYLKPYINRQVRPVNNPPWGASAF